MKEKKREDKMKVDKVRKKMEWNKKDKEKGRKMWKRWKADGLRYSTFSVEKLNFCLENPVLN
jgi:hypothetical protein